MLRRGRVQYERLARTELFRRGLKRVLEMSRDRRLALMCAEKEPLECHRTLLVAPGRDALGVEVIHILADGALERHEEAMERLLGVVGLPRKDLFRSRAELVEEALRRQAERIAYVDPRRLGEKAAEKP